MSMITYSQWGKKGNLGNQLFQYAAVLGLADKYNLNVTMPPWQWSKYFADPPQSKTIRADSRIEESGFHYDGAYWDHQMLHHKGQHLDIGTWLQSEKYWIDSKELIYNKLSWDYEFRKQTIDSLEAQYPNIFDRETIAVSVRRGDYVGNPNYDLLPASFYYTAILDQFPNWKDCNILIFSDDMEYCRIHFECLPNAFFINGNPIEQLCKGTLCTHFIISNSTFAWWMAYLGEKPQSKIIRPAYHFAGPLLEKCDWKDYYPERWLIHDHKGKKLNLRDVTFTVPVFYDHLDRKQNLDLSLCMLFRDFDTNVIVGEQGSDKFGYVKDWATYVKYDYDVFHRTRMLNDMAMLSETDIIVNWDADMFLPPLGLWMAVEELRNGGQMVYPFDGRVARMERNQHFKNVEKYLDIGIVAGSEWHGKTKLAMPTSSVGHVMMYNKEIFIQGGMENEYFISYGPEDSERWHRFHKLGYSVKRIKGITFHMNHFCGPNSSGRNPRFRDNEREWHKEMKMSNEELRAYVDTWPWVNQYTEKYYHTISEEAVESAKAMYSVLEKYIKFEKIVDIGCGIGEWNYKDYTGLDYRVPAKSLMIPKERYHDYDLRSDDPCPLTGPYDLVLCLEVAEHLPEDKAEKLVKLLCSLGGMVLFSAAIPEQPGVGHMNCQWQSWWQNLFVKQGFFSNEIRDEIIDQEGIALWYKQNTILYTKGWSIIDMSKSYQFDYVHPEMYMNIIKHLKSK